MFGIFWKFARIGERLSPYVSICCIVMAVCPYCVVCLITRLPDCEGNSMLSISKCDIWSSYLPPLRHSFVPAYVQFDLSVVACQILHQDKNRAYQNPDASTFIWTDDHFFPVQVVENLMVPFGQMASELVS